MKYTVIDHETFDPKIGNIHFAQPKIVVTEKARRLVSGHCPILIPDLVQNYGEDRLGMVKALLMQQLHFKLRVISCTKLEDINNVGLDYRFVAISIAEWHREFPIFSIRTIRRAFDELRDCGDIQFNGGTVTLLGSNQQIKKRTTFWTINSTRYRLDTTDPLPNLVVPAKMAIPIYIPLAKRIGLVGAIILQQTHYYRRRGPTIEGHKWLIKTFQQWHTDHLTSVCVRTIEFGNRCP